MNDNPARCSALIRATIFVRDIGRAARFYRVLGLSEVYYEGLLDHPSATAIIGLPEHWPFRVLIVKRPGPNFGMVGLFELPPECGVDAVPPAKGPARLGEAALVFYVRDMRSTLAALREAGATWSPEPRPFVMEHRSQLEVCLRDCDGVLLNLVETDPDEQERTRPELEYRGG